MFDDNEKFFEDENQNTTEPAISNEEDDAPESEDAVEKFSPEFRMWMEKFDENCEEILKKLHDSGEESDEEKYAALGGDQSAFHNMSCDLARKKDYRGAVKACEAGLKFGPNGDLYGDLINYHTKLNDINEAIHTFESMSKNVPKEQWTWRSFTFSIEMLLKDTKKNESVLLQLIEEYKRFLPHESKAVLAQYDVLTALGRDDEAFETLKNSVESYPAGEDIMLRLADILHERGLWESAKRIAMKAISAAAQSQTGINTPYAALIVCLSNDGIVFAKLAEGIAVEQGEVEKIVKQYTRLKDDFLTELFPYLDQINTRISLLQLFFPQTSSN